MYNQGVKSPHLISDASFYKYFRCPNWLVHEARGGSAKKFDPFLHLLQSEGVLREKQDELLKGRPVHDVNAEELEDAARETLELMKQGVPRIRGGVLLDGRYVGRPDILERIEGKSNFGDYYYVACDFKRSERVKEEYQMEAVFYADLLRAIQGVRPTKGYIAHANGAVSSFLIDELIAQFHITLEQIEKTIDQESSDIFLTSMCKQSPWFHKCVAEAEECRDLSLINRIWRSEVDALKNAGIKTVDDLAKADARVLGKVPDLTADRFAFLKTQATALVNDEVIALGEVDLRSEKNAYVIDIESDPMRDIVYLFGVLKIENGEESYHAFVADGKVLDEKAAWLKVNAFLAEQPEWPVYHYGTYEADVFRRLLAKYGEPMTSFQLFDTRGVDVIEKMRTSILFPSPFYSLKDVAHRIGFDWRADEASGLESIRWYDEWMRTQNPRVLQKIIDYNEDDVRATWLVKEWAAKTYGHNA